ncbi:MAG: GNAT family N-acetyltransferase [Planctomycetota bacterium]|nr:GNAT family N-acetyltransferase [Planctomycetota bacterium]
MLQTLTSPVLMNLTAEASYMLFHHAPDLRARMVSGGVMVLTGEPYADFNVILIESPRPKVGEHLTQWVGEAKALGLPFIVLIAPEAATGLAKTCESLGLNLAGSMPFMVCEATGFQVISNLDLMVNKVADERDWYDVAVPLAKANNLTEKSVRRSLPQALVENPAVDLYLARDKDGAPVGCVLLTSHGEVRGVWSMAVHPNHQRKGYGRAMLTQVMDEHHRLFGAKAFFLGSSPNGVGLYQRIGFRTIAEAPLWVKGETSQV